MTRSTTFLTLCGLLLAIPAAAQQTSQPSPQPGTNVCAALYLMRGEMAGMMGGQNQGLWGQGRSAVGTRRFNMGGRRQGMAGVQSRRGMGRQGMPGAPASMGAGMMSWNVTPPQLLLGAAEQLNLTANQTQRLESIQQQAMDQRRSMMQAAMTAQQQAAAALQSDPPDVDGYTSALKQAADLRVQALSTMVRSSVDARTVLTPDQRGQLPSVMEQLSQQCAAERPRSRPNGN